MTDKRRFDRYDLDCVVRLLNRATEHQKWARYGHADIDRITACHILEHIGPERLTIDSDLLASSTQTRVRGASEPSGDSVGADPSGARAMRGLMIQHREPENDQSD